MIGTKISDGTENDLSKEAKSAIPTSIYMTLQETMTEEKCSPRSSFSYQQHKRLEKKKTTCELFVPTKLQVLLCSCEPKTSFPVPEDIFFVTQLDSDLKSHKPTHGMRNKCRLFQYHKKDRDKH